MSTAMPREELALIFDDLVEVKTFQSVVQLGVSEATGYSDFFDLQMLKTREAGAHLIAKHGAGPILVESWADLSENCLKLRITLTVYANK